MKKIIKFVSIILLITVLSACNQTSQSSEVDSKDSVQQENEMNEKDTEKNNEKNQKSIDKEEETNPKDEIDLTLKPNENGQIMVLMYHGIGDEEKTWTRHHENFKKDLEYLYSKGYRPISLEDFVNNNINTKAGYTPIVITFDDGRQNNFNIIEKNDEKVIDSKSAVAILENFNKEHPDFPLEATFFLNGKNPFGQPELVEYKLNYIIDKGMDIGNHTINHNNMAIDKNQDAEKIQKYIAKEVGFINSILPNYKVDTYALCNGGRPNDNLEKYLKKGQYENIQYNNIAILNVGWKPSASPIDKDFNPLSIHRVRASEMNVDNVGMYDWLKYFENNPSKKYISDGKPNIITIPEKEKDNIDKNKIEEKELYIYESN